MPKISVIVPIYGVEKYIERCACSLFEQTMDDIEYIFVNDCTKDNSMGILKATLSRYPHRESQVKILDLPVNGGLPRARVQGLQMATGDYIAHCDSDVWVEVKAYEKLYDKAVSMDADIVFCDYYKGDETNLTYVHRPIDVTSSRNALYSITKHVTWNIWSGIVRRSLYQTEDLRFPVMNNGEDFAFMFQLIYNAEKLAKIDEPLYYYFFNLSSITNTPSEDAYVKRYEQLLTNTELVIDFIERKGQTKNYKDLVNCYKLFCRTKISPLTKDRKYRRMWFATFPELGVTDIMTNKVVPFKTILNCLAVVLGVYHLINR